MRSEDFVKHPPGRLERNQSAFLAAGEIRVCASCHGLNHVDQAGSTVPTSPPEALRDLLRHWKSLTGIFADGFESGNTGAWPSSLGD